MDSIKDRLDEAVRIAGVKNRRELSDLTDVNYGTLNVWIKRGKITAQGIMQITDKVPISKTYLETGEGDPHLDDTGTSNYGHDDIEDILLENYRMLDNETRKNIFHIVKKLAKAAEADLKF